MIKVLQTANKKGISNPQLTGQIKVKQQTAWFMLQRLKEAEKNNFFKGKFKDKRGGLKQNGDKTLKISS